MFTRRVLVTTVATVLLAGLPVVSARAPDAREQAPPADLVLTNGRIVTVDDSMPEAQAIAVTGDRITALGSSADMKRYVGANTKVIDVKGQLVMPGFIEGHGHFTGVGESQLQLNLMKVQTWDEIVAMVEQAAKTAKPGQWIRRARLAPGEMDEEAGPERRRLSDPRFAGSRVAEQPRGPHPRQRSRELRQCEGDGAIRRHAQHTES